MYVVRQPFASRYRISPIDVIENENTMSSEIRQAKLPKGFKDDFDAAAALWKSEGETDAGIEDVRAAIRKDIAPGPDTQRHPGHTIDTVEERIAGWAGFLRDAAAHARFCNLVRYAEKNWKG